MALEFKTQDLCLGWYFGAPKIRFPAIDRNGNKILTTFTNDDSQRVLYHFKAPTDKFYLERITPYLYNGAQAYDDCGRISYEPVEIEKSKELVKWKT